MNLCDDTNPTRWYQYQGRDRKAATAKKRGKTVENDDDEDDGGPPKDNGKSRTRFAGVIARSYRRLNPP